MTDLRERIAGVLLDRLADFHAGDLFMATQLAEAVLSFPGIAIVELPEPDSNHYDGEYGGPADRLAWLDIAGFDVSAWLPGEVQMGLFREPLEPISVADARSLAAALLAAAAQAQEEQ